MATLNFIVKIFFHSFAYRPTDCRIFTVIACRVAFVMFLLMPVTLVTAQRSCQLPEYDVKAAFLYKFALFIDWPEKAFAETSSSFIFGILGNDPFDKTIDEMLSNKKIKGKSIIIKRYASYKEIDNCHVLFISKSKRHRLKTIFRYLATKPILTVGETPGFADAGGIINFIHQNKNIRFEINNESAQKHHLNISSKLLRLAKIIK